jgi:hypothetical protein
LNNLCRQKASTQIIFSLELKLLHELGLEPNWPETSLTAGSRKIITLLLEKNFDSLENLRLTESQNDEIERFLLGFLAFHLDHLPKGRAEALKLTI